MVVENTGGPLYLLNFGAENLTKIKENLVVENRLLKERSSLVGNGLKGGVQRIFFSFYS